MQNNLQKVIVNLQKVIFRASKPRYSRHFGRPYNLYNFNKQLFYEKNIAKRRKIRASSFLLTCKI